MLANNPFLVYSRKFIFPKCKQAKKTCAAILYITVYLFFSFISTLTTSLMNAHSHINSFLFCRLDEIITNKCLGLVKPHIFTVYLCKLNLSKRQHWQKVSKISLFLFVLSPFLCSFSVVCHSWLFCPYSLKQLTCFHFLGSRRWIFICLGYDRVKSTFLTGGNPNGGIVFQRKTIMGNLYSLIDYFRFTDSCSVNSARGKWMLQFYRSVFKKSLSYYATIELVTRMGNNNPFCTEQPRLLGNSD